MSTVPPGKRLWKCPECHTEVTLSVTQLDPMACDACMQKLKAGAPNTIPGVGAIPTMNSMAPLVGFLPMAVVGSVALLVGLGIGFFAGRMSVPAAPSVRPTRPVVTPDTSPAANPPKAETHTDSGEDESNSPGPDYKWVKPYHRKDGTLVKGHWIKKKEH